MNGSAALDIRPHRRYVVEKAAAENLLPPQINFALFAPEMEFTQNLGLTPLQMHILLVHDTC